MVKLILTKINLSSMKTKLYYLFLCIFFGMCVVSCSGEDEDGLTYGMPLDQDFSHWNQPGFEEWVFDSVFNSSKSRAYHEFFYRYSLSSLAIDKQLHIKEYSYNDCKYLGCTFFDFRFSSSLLIDSTFSEIK